MIYVTVVGVLLSLGVLGAGLWALRRGLDRVAHQMRREDPEGLAARVDKLEWLIDELPQKWEEMAKQAKRSEDRARAVVRRAMEELEEAGYDHAGVEAEAQQLQLIHGDGSQEQRVQPVPEGLEPAQPMDGSEGEDWERVTAMRKYGGGR